MTTIGVDEVGRGCWAGPLVVGAVILDQIIPDLKDSKQLSPLKRQKLAVQIRLQAVAYALGWVSEKEIDQIGLTAATSLAIERAIEQINFAYDEILIDGSINYLKNNPKSRNLIKADQVVPSVSAASIIAKVGRDNYMFDMSKIYPEYGFDKHVGYGTQSHIDSLKLNGACSLHRLSFKPLKALTKALGQGLE
jgi:ribonuclease HII